MAFYDNSQWLGQSGQQNWEQQMQTPPTRSGASSTVPREEPGAFAYQIEEVDRAIDNLVKSGKMFGGPGGRATGGNPRHNAGRMGHGGSRQSSMSDYSESRGPHQGSNLQNFYAQQRHHQGSRGSNDAEQAVQAKRRMAAQRERELRNYHQEQQYNRNALAELASFANKSDRALSPGNMSEEDRRELIARQRSALYGEGPFAESGGYIDETGTPRQGVPSANGPAAALRGHSPLAYDYNRQPPAQGDLSGSAPQSTEGAPGAQQAGAQQRDRTSSNASPSSNQPGATSTAQTARRSPANSSPDPSRGGPPSTSAKSSSAIGSVAPIGTRPTAVSGAPPATSSLSKQPSSARLPSPLSQEYGNQGPEAGASSSTIGPGSNPPSATGEGSNVGLSGWGSRSGVWGNANKSGLGVQASVWG